MVDWEPIKILLCDSDAFYRKLVADLLYRLGARNVRQSDPGAEAIEVLKTFEADLVVAALHMDDDKGLEVVRWLRDPKTTTRPGAPVMMLTTVKDQAKLIAAIKTGVDHFLAKPTSVKLLSDRIARLLENPIMQVKTETYVGPDRRRLPNQAYTGPDRRGGKSAKTADAAPEAAGEAAASA